LKVFKPIKRRPHPSKRVMKRPLLGKRGVIILMEIIYLRVMEDES
jgi:hypothetical protein